MQGTFSPPPRNSNPDMHHGTCVTHVPWCMPGSLTSGFLWSRWRGKRSRHSRRMRNPQFCVSGKRPMGNLKLLAAPQQDDLQCLAPRLPGQSIWFASYRPSGLTLHIVPAPSLQPGDYNVSIIQWVRPQRNGWHFADDIFKRILIHISVKFASNLWKANIGCGSGLASNRRQVITWTNDGPVYWRKHTRRQTSMR